MQVTVQMRVQYRKPSGSKAAGTYQIKIKRGTVIEVDNEEGKARVKWDITNNRTWIALYRLSPESI